MRVLFDTNVVIDAAVPERARHGAALQLLSHVDRARCSTYWRPRLRLRR